MYEKCSKADAYNRDTFWYYLYDVELIKRNHVATTNKYYCEFVYVNVAGTFMAISYWNLQHEATGTNTLVRLGNGKAPGGKYEPIEITPSVLKLE